MEVGVVRGKVFFWNHIFFFPFWSKVREKGFRCECCVGLCCGAVLYFQNCSGAFRLVPGMLCDVCSGWFMCAFKYVCVQEWIDWNTSLGFTLSDWKKYFGGFLVIHEFLHIPPFFVPDEQTVVCLWDPRKAPQV